MRFDMRLVEMFAVAAIYLVMTMPISYATSVSVYFNGNPVYQPFELPSQADITASVSGATARIDITSTGFSELQAAYLYNCRGISTPSACRVSPLVEEYSYGFDGSSLRIEIPWDDIRQQNTANVLLVIKSAVSGGSNWLGYWIVITKSGTEYIVATSDISEVEMHISELARVQEVVQAVSARGMLPLNLLQKAVLKAADRMYELKGTNLPAASGTETQGNEITSLGGSSYIMAFGGDGSVSNAVSLYSKPPTVCGNAVCESGETTGTCCSDCGCGSPSLYCAVNLPNTAEGECRQTDSIGLQLKVAPTMKVDNCQIQNRINDLVFSIENSPPDVGVLDQSCTLENGRIGCSMSCEKAGGMYRCSITISQISGCTGSYLISGNSASFRISFPDGLSVKTKAITSGLPDITVSPAVCGMYGCEQGESCCADCGCTGGRICNAEGQEPAYWSCVQAPIAVVSNIGPLQFTPHDSANGDTVSFKVRVTNPTASLSYSQSACSILSCTGESGDCSASCSTTCTEAQASVPGTKEFDCRLWFKISPYEKGKGYIVMFDSPVDFSYRNGLSTNTLRVLNRITVGAERSFCGDGACGRDESGSSCCWDCGCEGGFCRSGSQPSASDACVLYSSLSPGISGLPPIAETTADSQISLQLKANFPNEPEVMTLLSSSCSTDEGIYCVSSCSPDGQGSYDCAITVAAIGDYSSISFFDSASHTVTLHGRLGFHVSLGDGARGRVESTITKDFTLPIRILGTCGGYGCESLLGETCCIDCGCPEGNLCIPGGSKPESTCRPLSEVTLSIDEAPERFECLIQPLTQSCIFTETQSFKARLFGVPENAILYNAEYSIGGGEKKSFGCVGLLDEENTYDCSLRLDSLAGEGESVSQSTLDVFFSVRYMEGGASEMLEVEASKAITLERSLSDAIISCQEQREALEDRMERYEKREAQLQFWFWTMVAISTVLFLAAVACSIFFDCGGAGDYLWYATAIFSGLSCVLGEPFLMSKMAEARAEMAGMSATLITLCDTTDAPDLGSLEDELDKQMNTYMAEVGGMALTCIIFTVSGMVSMSSLPALEGAGVSEGVDFVRTVQEAYNMYKTYNDARSAYESYQSYQEAKDQMEQAEIDLGRQEQEYEQLYGTNQGAGFGDNSAGTFPAQSV